MCIHYKVKKIVEDAVFGIGIFRIDGVQCYGTNTRIDRLERFDLEKDGKVKIELPDLSLLPGCYSLDVAIECDMGIPVDYYRNVCQFEVFSAKEDVGVMRLKHSWNLEV